MTVEEARGLLEPWIDPDDSLRGCSRERQGHGLAYILWYPGESQVIVDGACTAVQLTAIATWITETGKET